MRITGITLVEGKDWDNGDRLIARFDCEVRGFQLVGCLLIWTKRGSYLAQAPRGNGGTKAPRAITVIDGELRTEMRDAAVMVLEALTGEDLANG